MAALQGEFPSVLIIIVMESLRFALGQIKFKISTQGFERAWMFVKTAVKLKRIERGLMFLKDCWKRRVIPKFIERSVCISWMSDVSSRMRWRIREYKREMLRETIRQKVREVGRMQRSVENCRRQLRTLSKEEYLLVKGVAEEAGVREWISSSRRLEKKLRDLGVVWPCGSIQKSVSRETKVDVANPMNQENRQERERVRVTAIGVELTDEELRLLGQGPSFVPAPGRVSESELRSIETQLERGIYSLRFIGREVEEEKKPESGSGDASASTTHVIKDKKLRRIYRKGMGQPPTANKDIEHTFGIVKREIMKLYSDFRPKGKSKEDQGQILALRGIKARDDIVVKRSDKSKSLVVMEKHMYIEKVNEHLRDGSVYELVTTRGEDLEKEVCAFLGKWKKDFPKKLLEAVTPRHTSLPTFYGLPKVHKQGIPLRPVVAACDGPLTSLSVVIERVLNQLLEFVPGHLKNTADALQRIKDSFPDLGCPKNTIVVTMDVRALYPSIPIKEGVEAVRELLSEHVDDVDMFGLTKEVVISGLELILSNNVFTFDDRTYRQLEGIAMGNQVAPPLAVIFMGRLEERLLQQSKHKPKAYGRYMDDILFVWLHGKDELRRMNEEWNAAHPRIKFTSEDSCVTGSVSFMDVQITVKDEGKLEFQLYEKPSDSGASVPLASTTPMSSKMSIAQSHLLRAERLSSTPQARERSMDMVERKLAGNGYSKSWFEAAKKRLDTRDKTQRQQRQKSIVRLKLPYKSEELSRKVKAVLKRSGLPLATAYAVHRDTLQGRLTKSRMRDEECLYAASLKKKRGRGRPRKECLTCKWSATGSQNICRKKNTIYSITCALCGKEYVGETERRLDDRVAEHEADARHKRPQTPWGKHFRDKHAAADRVEFEKIHVIATAADIVTRKIREGAEIRDRKPAVNVSTGYQLL